MSLKKLVIVAGFVCLFSQCKPTDSTNPPQNSPTSSPAVSRTSPSPKGSPTNPSMVCGEKTQTYQYYWCGRPEKEVLTQEEKDKAFEAIKALAGQDAPKACGDQDNCGNDLLCKINHVTLDGTMDCKYRDSRACPDQTAAWVCLQKVTFDCQCSK